MTIRTTRRANVDLVDIYMTGTAKFESGHAERDYAGLWALISRLEEMPQVARLREEFVRPVRLYPYRAHIVANIEQENGILIVRVLHGRQDWARHLVRAGAPLASRCGRVYLRLIPSHTCRESVP